jgi:hypothetical protein
MISGKEPDALQEELDTVQYPHIVLDRCVLPPVLNVPSSLRRLELYRCAGDLQCLNGDSDMLNTLVMRHCPETTALVLLPDSLRDVTFEQPHWDGVPGMSRHMERLELVAMPGRGCCSTHRI